MHPPIDQEAHGLQGSSNRAFGIIFAIFFMLIALYPWTNGQTPRLWALVLGGICLLLAIGWPKALGPANRAWMKLGHLLQHLVSPITLALLFYLVVTPTGLLMRLWGKDLLRLHFDKAADSYWVVRNPPGPAADSLHNQF